MSTEALILPYCPCCGTRAGCDCGLEYVDPGGDWMTPEERFRYAVEMVLQHEGGYVNDPSDPGGETKYGISKRSYPHLDIANLTREEAIAIYRRDWWERCRIGEIEDVTIASKVLDLFVNVGPIQGATIVQRALHACGRRDVEIDGIMGSQTLAAINSVRPRSALLAAIKAEAAAYYRFLVERRPELRRFEQGWITRAYS